MADRGVLERDRADPLAARADHVLGAVGDLHVAALVDGRDVAGREPALGVERLGARRRVLEIGRGDPGPAHVQHARRLAVVGQAPARVVDDLEVDAPDRVALLLLEALALGLPAARRASG